MISTEILGMNRRNLQYVKKLNPKKSIRFVDKKYRTKHFLSQRWIPVWETYAFIKDSKELYNFDFASLPCDDFVIKPDRWSKWRWIFLVKRNINTEVVKSNWFDLLTKLWFYVEMEILPFLFKLQWKFLTDFELKKKMSMILDGTYSMWNNPDSILIEEKLMPGSWFERFCEFWLADIRVVVANLVPVAAMVRMPTKSSWWKANLAQWWVGIGIDIIGGFVKNLVIGWKYYQNDFPEKYKDFKGFKIPFWTDILSSSVNAQYFVNLWFVGVDWVITEDWPKLLEVNWKAGLEIQNISLLPLQRVLSKIIDLDIATPQKWIEVSKSLFSLKKTSWLSKSKVVYLSQKWILSCKKEDLGNYDVIVEASVSKQQNLMSPKVAEKILWSSSFTLSLLGNPVKFIDIDLIKSDSLSWFRIQLWTDLLQSYYIQPIHKSHPSIDFFESKKIMMDEVDDLQIFDQKLFELWLKMNFTKILKPVNYWDEFDKFVSKQWKYNPVFKYKFPSNDVVSLMESSIKNLFDRYKKWGSFQSVFANLFYEKLDELKVRLDLLKAYKKQDFEAIYKNNELLYWEFDDELVSKVEDKLEEIIPFDKIKLWSKLSMEDVVYRVKKYLRKYNIRWVDIKLDTNLLPRIVIGKWKVMKVKLNPSAFWYDKELDGQLVHELGVHLKRALSGKQKWWLLLEKWTWFYLKDEEWLAVFQAENYLKKLFPEYENYAIWKKYYLCYNAQSLDFSQMVTLLKGLDKKHWEKHVLRQHFNTILRIKSWIKDTSKVHKWAISFKSKVYLDGYLLIKNLVENGEDLKKYMMWKIKTEDLKFIR